MANKVFEYDGKVFLNKAGLIKHIMDTTGQGRNIAVLTASNTMYVQTKFVDNAQAKLIRQGGGYLDVTSMDASYTDTRKEARDTWSISQDLGTVEKTQTAAETDYTDDGSDPWLAAVAPNTSALIQSEQIAAEQAWVEMQNAQSQASIAASNALLARSNAEAALKSGLTSSHDILMKGSAERGIQSTAAAASGISSGSITANLQRNKLVTDSNALMAKTKARNDMSTFLLQKGTFEATSTNMTNQADMYQTLIGHLHRQFDTEATSLEEAGISISASGNAYYSAIGTMEGLNTAMDFLNSVKDLIF